MPGIIGALLILMSLALTASLVTYDVHEAGWTLLNPFDAAAAADRPCTNLLGVPGLYMAGLLYATFGAMAFYLLLLLFIEGLVGLLAPWHRRLGAVIALLLMLGCSLAIFDIQPWLLQKWAEGLGLKGAGGMLGYLYGRCVLSEMMGGMWALVLLIAVHGAALIYFGRTTPRLVALELWSLICKLCGVVSNWFSRRSDARSSSWRKGATEGRAEEEELPEELRAPEPPRSLHLPGLEPEAVPAAPQFAISSEPRDVRQDNDYTPPPSFDTREERLRAESARYEHVQAPPTHRSILPSEPRRVSHISELMQEVESRIEKDSYEDEHGTRAAGHSQPVNMRPLPPIPASRPQPQQNQRPPLPIPTLRPLPPTPAPQAAPQPQQSQRPPLPIPALRPLPPTPAPQAAPQPQQNQRPPLPIPTPRPLPQEDPRVQEADYPLPPYELLTYVPASAEHSEEAKREMAEMQEKIISALKDFRIPLEPGPITRGPSITRYEFYPPKGLKIDRIANYAKDLMMATCAETINILTPIPGSNTIGIELANAVKTPVYLRELLQDSSFHSPKIRIPVALGRDVYGKTVIGDLAGMPHTLVAGTTGSGKSVCINSMIISMLYKFRPDELKLILVDPKVVEMQPYKHLPHLACPVVTSPGRVISALRWAVNEMEHRYKLFSKIGVRNFEDYNRQACYYDPSAEATPDAEEPVVDYALNERIASEIERQAEDEIPLEDEDGQAELDFEEEESIPLRLPYIVIIIDELSDLMMMVKDDLETQIARLTQKARAAGIHLVVATQTPRSNVVTGIIKANIPSRIAFKVASQLDSRIILDNSPYGAETLLGQGDFLFLPPGGISRMTRAQGAFVTDEEVAMVVKHCASHARQNFEQGVIAEMEQGENGANSDNGGRLAGGKGNEEDEELYTRCVSVVVTERRASTSLLQRRLSIGYGRAAKMMDIMEQRGVISSPQGATRAREVLIDSPV